MSFDLETLRVAVAQHGVVTRVVIASHAGSSPREAGAAMLIWADGQAGTIGGGALEHDATVRARAMAGRSMVLRVPLGPALGQCCGGAVTLVLERFDAGTLPDAVADKMPDQMAVFARRVDGPLAQPNDSNDPAQVSGAATYEPPMPLPVRDTLARLRNGNAAGAPVAPILSHGWLIEALHQPTRALWIWGAGHVGRALVSVLSPLPDFSITWVDTAPDRFPHDIPAGVTRLPAAQPADLVRHAPVQAEHLILTYSHALDLALCHQLLGHGFGYAGLIGSASKWARFQSRLRGLGHGAAQISRITCPIGDPALGKHPQALAIGVAATLLARADLATRARVSGG